MNKEELMILPTPQGTSYCSCLEHCFMFVKLHTRTRRETGRIAHQCV